MTGATITSDIRVSKGVMRKIKESRKTPRDIVVLHPRSRINYQDSIDALRDARCQLKKRERLRKSMS